MNDKNFKTSSHTASCIVTYDKLLCIAFEKTDTLKCHEFEFNMYPSETRRKPAKIQFAFSLLQSN